MKMIPDNSDKDFLGTGWAFPVGLKPNGKIASAAFEEDVRQSILIILSTNPGERLMHPDFGAGLNTFLFEPASSVTTARVKKQVEEALINWEPRLDLKDVLVTVDPSERHKLLINVRYCIRATNSLHNLVYPFYLEEGTEK